MSRKVLAALALAALLTGCGHEKDHRASGTAEATSQEPATSPAGRALSRTELEQGLLVLGDLPTGYTKRLDDDTDAAATEQPDDGVVPTAPDPECTRFFHEFQDTGLAVEDPSKLTVEYEKSDLGPLIEQELASYPDLATPRAEIARVNAAVATCGQFTMTEPDGDITIKLTATSFPALGDESAAFKLNATGGSADFDLTMSGYLVTVRVGNTVCTVVHFGWPEVDAAETEGVTRKAVDKLTALS